MMEEKHSLEEKKLHKRGWKSRFVKLMGMMTICFNVLSAPLTAIGIATMAVTTVALVVSCDKDDQNKEQPTTQKNIMWNWYMMYPKIYLWTHFINIMPIQW